MIGGLIRITVKGGLAGGAVYYYHQAGLWKDADETIKNWDKLKLDFDNCCQNTPYVKDYYKIAQSYISSSIVPLNEKMKNFKNEWLTFDISWAKGFGTEDGLVKPIWNKGITFSTEFLANSPEYAKSLSKAGFVKIQELSASASDLSKSSSKNTVSVENVTTKPSSSIIDNIEKN